MGQKTLADKFHGYVETMIDEKGIYPFPGMSLRADGKFHVAAITDARLAFNWFWTEIATHGASEVVFGLDRTTKPDQGTLFADVLTCAYWCDGMDGKSWEEAFVIGVIDYQVDPRIVSPWNWDNAFWTDRMWIEVASCRPPIRIRKSVPA